LTDRLGRLGVPREYLAYANPGDGPHLGRIIGQHRDCFTVMTSETDLLAHISGKFRKSTTLIAGLPAVGDYVLVDRLHDRNGPGVINELLPRKTAFLRKAAGRKQAAQVIAANVDTVFICMSLNNDFNLRRLERYLAVAWESGAAPVVVLTKADLAKELEMALAEIAAVAGQADVLVTSGLQMDGYHPLLPYVQAGKTVAFIGSSGVGKTTLINGLLGKETLATGGIRNDDRGRHTTSRRDLIALPSGGAVIDTPGMRELGLLEADLDKTFSEIARLTDRCKFRDCTHKHEPGCAVRQAVEYGEISPQRLASFHKLARETRK